MINKRKQLMSSVNQIKFKLPKSKERKYMRQIKRNSHQVALDLGGRNNNMMFRDRNILTTYQVCIS